MTSIKDALKRTVSIPRDGGVPTGQDTFGVQQFGFTHDHNGNPTGVTSPQSGSYSEAIGYTPVDQVESFNLPAGPFSISYDSDRQPTGGSSPYSGGGLGFDDKGRLSQLGPISYEYDADDYLTTITSADGSITYGYDNASAAPTSITYGGPVTGVVTIERNDLFQATKISVGASEAQIQVDADGVVSQAGALEIRRNEATFITGTTVGETTDTYTRNQLGEPTAYTARYGTTELFSEEYVRDRGGRITQKTVRIRNPDTDELETYTADYGYDAPGRLETVTYNGTDTNHYAYDGNNNLIGAPEVSPTPVHSGPVRLYLHEAAPTVTPAVTGGTWSDTQASEIAAMGKIPDGALRTTTVSAADCSADGQPRRLLANVFVSPPLAEAHEFTGEEQFSVVVGAAESAVNDALVPIASIWVMNGSTGSFRCGLAGGSFATSGPLPVTDPLGIEGQLTVTGCTGQTAQANDRLVMELGFACTPASIAPVSGSLTRGGTGTALGSGSDPAADACQHPGYLQVDGGLVFSGATAPSPCDPADSALTINSRRLTSVTVDAANQATDAILTDPQGVTHYYHYEYDTRGALQSKVELDAPAPSGAPIADPTTYQYDEFGNLRHVALPDGTTIDYLIHAANRRVGRTVTTAQGSTTQRFLYQSGLRPVAEVDGSGNVVAFFVYGDKPNVPEYMEKGGQRYRIVTDHLGSVKLVVNASTGAVAQRIDYDEHGNVLRDTSPGFQPFGFAGGMYDPMAGVVRFCARDYDPETSRWTMVDPVGFGGNSANLYTYVDGDPVSYSDPFGLVRWRNAIEASFGVVGNAFGIAAGVGLALVPEPTLVTKAAAAVTLTKTTYGIGVSGANLVAAVLDNDPVSNGSLLNDVAAKAAPGNVTAQRVASIVDLGTDLGIGRVATSAATRATGITLEYEMKRVFVRDPGDLGTTVRNFQILDAVRQVSSVYGDVFDEYQSIR